MSTRPGRTRVAVVFGGRSSEHAISCVSAGSVLRHLDRERFDVVPVGIAPRRRLGAGHGRPRAARDPRPRRCRRSTRRPPPSCCRATRPAVGWWCSSRAGPVRCSAASTSSSPCCTGPSARTARSRGCWRWPACPTSARACSPAPRAWTRSSRRSCSPPTACRSATSWCCGRGTPTLTADAARAARPAGVRQARPGRLVGGHHPGHRLGRRSTTRSPPPARTTRRCWSRRRSSGREVECGVLELPDGTVRASLPAEIRIVGSAALLRLRREVPRRRLRVRHPREARRRRHRAGPGRGRRGVPGAGLPGPRAGRLLRRRRTACRWSTR